MSMRCTPEEEGEPGGGQIHADERCCVQHMAGSLIELRGLSCIGVRDNGGLCRRRDNRLDRRRDNRLCRRRDNRLCQQRDNRLCRQRDNNRRLVVGRRTTARADSQETGGRPSVNYHFS